MSESNMTSYFSTEEVAKNKGKSVLLILIMVAIILALSAMIGYLSGAVESGLIVGVIISVIVIPIQIFTAKMAILAMTKGKELDLSNPRHRRLQNITEGLALSAGMKRVPKVYITPSDVPNAFASGLSEKDAFVCVTQGLLNMLDDQELAGVVGHEISHIVHRDIMLSQLSVSLVSVIILLSSVLARIAYFGSNRSSDRENKTGAFFAFVMIAAVLIQPIARIVANLIELAISRKREYAADAYSVRLCGYNEGLARALEKIGGVGKYSKQQVESLGGENLKCMYINFPMKNAASLFSTHPPIEERVRRVRNMY